MPQSAGVSCPATFFHRRRASREQRERRGPRGVAPDGGTAPHACILGPWLRDRAARRRRAPGRLSVRVSFPAAAVLLLAWTVALVVYPAEELGLDGHLAAGLALLPTDRMLGFLAGDVHPPGYYFVLKEWLGLVGPAFAVARWPSLASGVLALALAYRLVRGLAGGPAALAGALLLALTPAQAVASATARDTALGLRSGSPRSWPGGRSTARRSEPSRPRRSRWRSRPRWRLRPGPAWSLAVQLLDLAGHRGPTRAGRWCSLGAAANAPWRVIAGPDCSPRRAAARPSAAPRARRRRSARSRAARRRWPRRRAGPPRRRRGVVPARRPGPGGRCAPGDTARWGRLARPGCGAAAATYVLASAWNRAGRGRVRAGRAAGGALVHGWALAPRGAPNMVAGRADPAGPGRPGRRGRVGLVAASAAALVVALPNLVWGARGRATGWRRTDRRADREARRGRATRRCSPTTRASAASRWAPAAVRAEARCTSRRRRSARGTGHGRPGRPLTALLRRHDRVWLGLDRDLWPARRGDAPEGRVAEGRFPVRREERGRARRCCSSGGGAAVASGGPALRRERPSCRPGARRSPRGGPDGPLRVEPRRASCGRSARTTRSSPTDRRPRRPRLGQHDGEQERGLSPTWAAGRPDKTVASTASSCRVRRLRPLGGEPLKKSASTGATDGCPSGPDRSPSSSARFRAEPGPPSPADFGRALSEALTGWPRGAWPRDGRSRGRPRRRAGARRGPRRRRSRWARGRRPGCRRPAPGRCRRT